MGRRFGHLARLLSVTSAPTSPAAGDLWFRSDLSQFRGSDGGAGTQLTIGPEGNVPVIRPTAWHNWGYGNAATINMTDQRLYCMPFWPGRSCTLTGMATNVTAALVGSVMRYGIYTSSDGVLPTNLLTDFGTVTSAVTGIRSITGLNSRVRPVLHYLVVVRQTAGGVLTVSARSAWDPIVSDTTPTITANTNAYFYDAIAGALPATLGTPDGTDQGPCPVVQLT